MNLRETTAAKHAEIEALPFTQYMVSGKITKEHYTSYLLQMLFVYAYLESNIEKNNVLADLPGLLRADLIKRDYEECVGTVDSTHNLALLQSTLDYCNYLHAIEIPGKSLAHAYVRYMGDMAGGQMIKKLVPGSGKFYDFENLKELMGSFRSKLVDVDVEEALVAFDYNIAIAKELGLMLNVK